MYLSFEQSEESKIFPNEAFGYWKITVERPLRAEGIDTSRAYTAQEIRDLKPAGRVSRRGVPVIRRILRKGTEPDPMYGRFPVELDGDAAVVEYEPDIDARDVERVPRLEPGGIQGFFTREVLPDAPDAWVGTRDPEVGYEISFVGSGGRL